MENPSHEVQVEDIEVGRPNTMSATAERRWVTATLLVAMMVTAIEQLVVSPAMPTIIAQLKGFEIYPWVISAFLLAATVSTTIYGRPACLFGRKRVLLGLILFSLGSILSGTQHGPVDRDADDPGLQRGAVGPIVLTMSDSSPRRAPR